MFYKGIGLNMQNSPQNVAVMEENLYKTMNLYIPVEECHNHNTFVMFLSRGTS
jgi:hypothetical protein